MINFAETVLNVNSNVEMTIEKPSTMFTYAEASMAINEIHVLTYDLFTMGEMYSEGVIGKIGALLMHTIKFLLYPFRKLRDYFMHSYNRRHSRKVIKKLGYEDYGFVQFVSYSDKAMSIERLALRLESQGNSWFKYFRDIPKQLSEFVNDYKQQYDKLVEISNKMKGKENADIAILEQCTNTHSVVNTSLKTKPKIKDALRLLYSEAWAIENKMRYVLNDNTMFKNNKPNVNYNSKFKIPVTEATKYVKTMLKEISNMNSNTSDVGKMEVAASNFLSAFNACMSTGKTLTIDDFKAESIVKLSADVQNGEVTRYETNLDALSVYLDMSLWERSWDENNEYWNKSPMVLIAKKAGLLDFTQYEKEMKDIKFDTIQKSSELCGKILTVCMPELIDAIEETNLSIQYCIMTVITICDTIVVKTLDDILNHKSDYGVV